MALDSFVRDFNMVEIDQHTRDGIQANIVSTFQVCIYCPPTLILTVVNVDRG